MIINKIDYILDNPMILCLLVDRPIFHFVKNKDKLFSFFPSVKHFIVKYDYQYVS